MDIIEVVTVDTIEDVVVTTTITATEDNVAMAIEPVEIVIEEIEEVFNTVGKQSNPLERTGITEDKIT